MMKLSIARDQDKGMLGGISFVLNVRLVPTPEEQEAIRKYKAGDLIAIEDPGGKGVTVDQLLAGWSRKAKDIVALLNDEKEIVGACSVLVSVLKDMQAFVGEERRELAPGLSVSIRRSQGTRFFGGTKFNLMLKIEASPEMVKLVDHYKLRTELVSAGDELGLTIGRLLEGVTFEGSVQELHQKQKAVLEGCDIVRHQLAVMASFGGESRTQIHPNVVFCAKREQHKGMLGGVSFSLHVRLETAKEISAIVEKYKAHKFVLATRGGIDISAGQLINGMSEKCKDVTTLLNNEDVMKKACDHFLEYVSVMQSFGGREEIQIDAA